MIYGKVGIEIVYMMKEKKRKKQLEKEKCRQ